MAAAVASATVEPATTTTVEAVAAMESAVITAAMETAAVAATDEAVGFTAPVAVTAASMVAVTSVEAMTVVAAAIKSATVEAMPVEPRAGADEDAAGEVVRPVETVRSAGVRIVAVVTVSADWRRADGAVHGTYSNGHANLCVGASRSKKQNSQQSSIF
jgi:hypothetical protein